MDDDFLQRFDSSSPTFSESIVNPPRPGYSNIYRKIVTSANEVIFAETYLYGEYECHVRKEEFIQKNTQSVFGASIALMIEPQDLDMEEQEKKIAYERANLYAADELEATLTAGLA